MKKLLLLVLAAAGIIPDMARGADLFFTDFATESELTDKFTTINANDDGNWWRWYSKEIFCHENSSIPMDDWLITKGLSLEGGKDYLLSFYAYATDAKNTERLEVKLGTSATVDGMTTELLAPTDITQLRKDRQLTYVCFKAPADGTYYIGFHGISAPNRYNLYLDDIRVSDGDAAKAPLKVADFKATPDANCAKSATLTFTVPDKAIDGTAVTSIKEIVIKKNDRVVSTVTDAAPGEKKSVFDKVITKTGEYTWTITVANDYGVSQESTATAFVGPNAPVAPMNVQMEEIASGKVKLTWDPVTRDIDGKTLSDDMVTYGIIADDRVIDEGITDTEYIEQIVREGRGQEFVSLAVYAITDYDQGTETYVPLMPIGTDYTLPFAESFPNSKMTTAWAMQDVAGSGNSQWRAVTEDAGIDSKDHDNGLVAGYTPYEGDMTRLISGKVSLKDVTNPALQVYYYNILGGYNSVGLQIRRLGEKDFVDITGYDNDPEKEGWQRMCASIKDYAGSVVQFAIIAEMGNQYYSVFDNIKIFDSKEVDLRADDIVAPKNAKPGDNIKITALVENNGIAAVDGFTATLYRDGKAVKESEPMNVDAYGAVQVSFTDVVTPLYKETTSYSVVINNAGDSDTSNNSTASAIVDVLLPAYPAPEALTGNVNADGVELTWLAPDADTSSVPAVLEDFESYGTESLTGFGDWTVVDVDGDPTYSLQEVDLPFAQLAQAFTIFDTSWASAASDADYSVHSGKQCAISMSAGLGFPTDDWLISPRLSGEAQTVSFYARALYDSYEESFEFLYSVDGTDISEFKRVDRDLSVPEEWTYYSFEIPEGAQYFAIRCTSNDALMFMVDDISYTPFGHSSAPLQLTGYNVYRNGEKLNAEPVVGEKYTDNETIEGEAKYIVTAVYDRGESVGSNELQLITTALKDLAETSVTVRAVGRNINIDGAEGLGYGIFTASGVNVASGTASSAHVSRAVPSSGVYVVKVGTKAYKLVVR